MQSNFVHVIDDDDSLRNAIVLILQEAGYQVGSWAGAKSFLEESTDIDNSVILLDLQMPDLTGLGLISDLNQSNMNVQVVFISGHAAPSEVVAAFRQGAYDFLLKPFDMDTLLSAVEKAMQVIVTRANQKIITSESIDKFNTLTPREKLLFERLLSSGKIKDIAKQLDLAEITVKVYKAKILHKLGVSSQAELVLFSQSLNLTPTAG
jgi:FixJ family two-component response regulator